MRLNYKTLIIGILCFSVFGLTDLARADTISELKAEMARLNADVEAWNVRCARTEHTGESALREWCVAESARLEARKADLLARIKAASGQ